MLAIIGGRQTGKTTCLIEMSNETGYPILTTTQRMAQSIELMARRMNVNIPPVLSITEMPRKGTIMRGERVLVDDLGIVAEHIIGAEVVAASIDGVALVKAQPPSTDLSKLGIWEAFKLWRSERKHARLAVKICEG